MAKKMSKTKKDKLIARLQAGDKPSAIARENGLTPQVLYYLNQKITKSKDSNVKAKRKPSVYKQKVRDFKPRKDVLATGTREEKRELLIRLLSEDVLNS